MKRKSLILLISLVISALAFSSRADDKVRWGAKLSVEGVLPTKLKSGDSSFKLFHNGVGFTVGAVSHINIASEFFVEPGLSFFYSKYKYDITLMENLDKVEVNPPLTKMGVQLPVVLGYQANFTDMIGIRLYMGPQIRYAFAGKVGIKDPELREEYEPLLLWDCNRRFELSWKAGIGVPIDNFMISAEADFGLTNLTKTTTITGDHPWRMREFRVGGAFTYYF